MDANEAVVFPEDFSALSLDELTALQSRALAEFDALAADEGIDDTGVARLEALAAGIEQLNPALANAQSVTMSNTNKVSDAKTRIAKVREAAKPAEAQVAVVEAEAPAKPAAAVVASTQVRQPASLAVAQASAPQIPAAKNNDLVITAAAPTSNVQVGSRFDSLDTLVTAINTHAKSLVITEGRPGFQTVASIQNKFDETIDGDRTSLSEFAAMVDRMKTPDTIDALVAGGGWCAPSEIKYDFFNIACEDGMVDLPTFGVNRGGIQFPVSPSMADVFTGSFTNATNPWLWQEIDDIAAATGTGGTPSKPCVRVMCPTFDNRRLECYGICLTAGNLTDSAYPEATRNHLALLMSAHYHAMNQRYIQTMVSLSSAAVTGAAGIGTGILADAPVAVGIAAQDYRTRYGMCNDDVLEVVFPRWVKDAMRADHLRRTGFWEGALTDADIDALFRAYRVRVQWVSDWQVRSAGQFGGSAAMSDWPATATFMIYAAGTFVRGNGLTLDLGVVRDSVLNKTNDHTAAWTEECHLIARYGHESRQYTIPVSTAGRTGAANIVAADV